jgi:hypothetical protein
VVRSELRKMRESEDVVLCSAISSNVVTDGNAICFQWCNRE